MSPLRWIGTAVVALALVTGACVDDPGELESSDLRALIVRGLVESDEENALHFTEPEAECVADRVMRAVSDDRLKDLGVDERKGLSTLAFTPAEQDVVFDALAGCTDLTGQVAATLQADTTLTAEQAGCIAASYVTSEPFREAMFSEEFDAELNQRIDDELALAGQGCGLGPG